MVQIVIIDFGGNGISHAEMAAVAAALSIQCQQHFGLPPPLGHGIAAIVRAGLGPYDVRPHEWVLGLFSHPDVANALGYHDQTVHGQPFMKVFPLLDKADGVQWPTTASHEILETLKDPNVACCAMSYDGRFWAYEVGDAVEATWYLINGVQVSNFVLPPYFEPVQNMHGLKYDWMNLVTRPLQILPGGYGQYFDPSSGWNEVLAQAEPVDGVPPQPQVVPAPHLQPRAYRRDYSGRRAKRRAVFATAKTDRAPA